MISVVQTFPQVYDVSQNNIIIGDFNVADNDMEKGKGMDYRDQMMTSIWEGFTSAMALRGPFRSHYTKKRIYSFVNTAGRSRGERMYVNDENIPNISENEYTPTFFTLAHKMLSRTITDQQERGRGYWKLNSSVLNDNACIAMVRQTSANVEKLSIRDEMVGHLSHQSHVQNLGVHETETLHRECMSRGPVEAGNCTDRPAHPLAGCPIRRLEGEIKNL